MKPREIRDQFTPKPSSTRIKKHIAGASAESKTHAERSFGGEEPNLTQSRQPQDSRGSIRKAARQVREAAWDTLKPIAPLMILGSLAVGVMTARDGDTAPVDVDSLPKGQLTRYIPPSGKNPEEIARQVTDGDTDIDQLTGEIKAQIGDSSGLNEPVLLPNSQIDPSLTKK